MDLFSPPYIQQIRLRLLKLDVMRTFYDTIEGGFYSSKILYTTQFTCEHSVFDRVNKYDFKCRECGGIIVNKQIIHNLTTKTK